MYRLYGFIICRHIDIRLNISNTSVFEQNLEQKQRKAFDRSPTQAYKGFHRHFEWRMNTFRE